MSTKKQQERTKKRTKGTIMDFAQDAELELKNMREKIQKLEAENNRLKEVIKDNDLQAEIEDIDCTSLEELICLNGINHIATLVESGDFHKDDITNFNTLFNILRSIKGKSMTSKKKPKGEIGDLLKMIKGDNK